jgi:LysR family nitrogen assimilation transcriptional regulator
MRDPVELVQLRSFIEVAERGSFTHAAAALGVNQPALSRQIRRLEVELHRNLLYRHGRGVRLTDAGERFATTARSVLQQLDVAAQLTPENDTGRITIGLPPPFGRLLTVRLVRAFASHFPLARIAVVEGTSSNLEERVRADEIDIALLHTSVNDTKTGWERIVNEPLCLIAPRSRDETEAPTVSLATVAKSSLICPTARTPIRTIIENAAERCGFTLDIAQEIDAMDTILELVQNGFGYAIGTAGVLQNTPYAKTLQLRRIVDPALFVTLSLASCGRRPPAPLYGKSVALLKDVIGQALGIDR